MLDGLDVFFQARLLAEYELLPSKRKAKVLPFVAAWCRRAEKLTAADALRALGQVFLMREKAVAAMRKFDFLLSPTSPITAYAVNDATPGNDPAKPFEHIGFTAPFNMSEQPACSICAGYDTDGLPIGLQIVGHRFDDLGVLQMAHAYETLRPALRPWPEPTPQSNALRQQSSGKSKDLQPRLTGDHLAATRGAGIGAPKNTPAAIVDKLNTEINAALADPKMKARLAELGRHRPSGLTRRPRY
jgi:hypothetical protein